jgi:virulence factor Mce-like protein
LHALRARFAHIPGEQRSHAVRNGAISLVLIAVVLFAGYSRQIPLWPKGGEVVRAEFADAGNVRGGQEVRVRGVKVGAVDGVERSADGDAAIVTMRLDVEPRPELRRDAGAAIYWRTLLGRNMYIELEPGHAAGTLGDAVIPKARTHTQVELDQALEPLDDRGRANLQDLMETFREGLGDTPHAGEALEAMAPGLRPAGPGLRALRGEHDGDLQRVVDRTAATMSALNRGQDELAGLVDGAAITLGVTAARRADIAGTLRSAPPTLRRARGELVALRSTLDRLDPLAGELRPGARGLDDAARAATPALRAAQPLLRSAEPLLHDLQPAVRRLRSLGRAGKPLVDKLEPTVVRTRDDILPWLTSRDDHTGRRIFELLGPTFSFLAALTQGYDMYGHDVPFQGGSGTRAGGTLFPCEALLTDPTETQKVKCNGLAKGLGELFSPPPRRRGR